MIFAEKQGQVIRVVNLSPKPTPPRTSKRGKIVNLSRKARRRMIDFMARMDLDGTRTTFLTLTFHGLPSNQEAKRALKQFLQKIRRDHPEVSGVWRCELQERGSIHFHLLLFNLPYWKQREIQERWQVCTGEVRSIVHVKLMRNGKQTMFYLSKYISKVDEASSIASLDNAPYQHTNDGMSVGRQWGWFNKASLPMAERRTALIVSEDLAEYFWWTASAIRRDRHGNRRSTQRLYTDQASEMFEWMLRHGAFDTSTWDGSMFGRKELSPKVRTKTSAFLAGLHTHL